MTAPRIALVLAGTLVLSLLAPVPVAAQDNDQIYAVNRRDAEMRAARRGESPSARGFSFPGLPFFGGRNSRQVPEITVNPRGVAIDPVTGLPIAAPRTTLTSPGANAFCVRTCDGFYFPAGRPMTGTGRAAQQETCQRLCPGAEVALYSTGGGSIEQAVGPRGQTYASLRTAFRFRERVDAACTCAGASTNGLARIPITHDPTLRAGDVVVTEGGVRVFAGGPRFPYRQADFVSARTYGRMPADIRRRVAEIEAGIRAQDSGTTAPVSRLGPAAGRPLAARPEATMASTLTPAAGSGGIRIVDINRPAGEMVR